MSPTLFNILVWRALGEVQAANKSRQNSSVFCDRTLCNLANADKRFGRTCFEGWWVSQARNQLEEDSKLSWFRAWLTFHPSIWRRRVPWKRLLTLTVLRVVISQKTEFLGREHTKETGNRNFRETSPISSRQLVSSLAGAHWGNLCLISCSHFFKWLCSSDVIHDCIFQFPRIVISLSWTDVTEWSSANWGKGNAISRNTEKLNFQATEHASLHTIALPHGFLVSAVL
jgi:hypothetical protein